MSNYGANPYRTMLGEVNHTQDTPQVPTLELVDPGPGSGVVGEWVWGETWDTTSKWGVGKFWRQMAGRPHSNKNELRAAELCAWSGSE